MTTAFVTHIACLDHDPGSGHPEHAGRLAGILEALEEDAFADLLRLQARPAERSELLRVHPAEHIDAIMSAVPASGHRALDPDTRLSPGSGEAILRAAGGVCVAVDAVESGQAANAFVAVRPPGHHAERAQAMGFCFFNNVVVGAMHARAVYGRQRVAVVDWDVHHGNGVQNLFWDDAEAFYASTHQAPFYPGTGAAFETGAHRNIVNVPLPAGSDGEVFRCGMEDTVFPALRAFNPDIIFISAGFDAHARDPLANLRLKLVDFVWATTRLMAIAAECCNGRLVSVLEGGYDVDATAACAAAHVLALMRN